jgi:hypothetical protein
VALRIVCFEVGAEVNNMYANDTQLSHTGATQLPAIQLWLTAGIPFRQAEGRAEYRRVSITETLATGEVAAVVDQRAMSH